MLEEKDFAEIRDYVIRILPELLRQEPEVAATIEGILAEHFPRRDEFARLLDELAKLREDTNRQFEQTRQEMNRRFELLQEEMDRRFELLREEMDRRFDSLREEMNQQFELMHQEQLGIKQDVSRLRSAQEGILKRMDAQDKWVHLVTGQ
jgi:DNA anti-recombination protein RmuC